MLLVDGHNGCSHGEIDCMGKSSGKRMFQPTPDAPHRSSQPQDLQSIPPRGLCLVPEFRPSSVCCTGYTEYERGHIYLHDNTLRASITRHVTGRAMV